MNEIIFDDLRFEVEEKVKNMILEKENECYLQNKQSLENAPAYAQCIQGHRKNIAEYERKAKYRLLFMEISSRTDKKFNLTEEVGKFMKDYEMNIGDVISLT